MIFLVATNNQHKIEEIKAILADERVALSTPADIGLRLDVVEDGETYAANARIKACAFAAASGMVTLADDSGLEVAALDGAPGIHSARFLDGQPQEEKNREIIRRLAAVKAAGPARAARFACVIVAAWPDGREAVFHGECPGAIAGEPQGEHGFGYDPIFLVDGYGGKTMAELAAAEKNLVSHRARALQALQRSPVWAELARADTHGGTA